MIMEGDPFVLIEGMTIAGLSVGATQGYIYLRSEYPHALRTLNEAIAAANARGYLGEKVAGTPYSISRSGSAPVRTSAARRPRCSRAWRAARDGALQAAGTCNGRAVRAPTMVNNVISLASVPVIIEKGGGFYKEYGMGRSRGTSPSNSPAT